jgi:hemolysin D
VSHDAVASRDGGKQSVESGAPSPGEEPANELSYVAYVRLSRNWMDTETGHTQLTPGMMVTAEIHTGRRRIIDYLLSPLQRKVSESLHER